MEFALVIEGIRAGTYIGDLSPAKVATAARQAINKIADRTRTRADRMIREQVAFPARYLGPSAKRLWVENRASNNSLEATIRGQGRPTSLARFTKQKPLTPGRRHKGGGVNVTVKPGQRKFVQRAFLMRLRNDNIGLAVRTSGGKPENAYKPKSIGKNLWLLYGPSVDQTLFNARRQGIYEDLSPEILDALDAEFQRLVDLEMSK